MGARGKGLRLQCVCLDPGAIIWLSITTQTGLCAAAFTRLTVTACVRACVIANMRASVAVTCHFDAGVISLANGVLGKLMRVLTPRTQRAHTCQNTRDQHTHTHTDDNLHTNAVNFSNHPSQRFHLKPISRGIFYSLVDLHSQQENRSLQPSVVNGN